jgi:hypothetical protein
MKCQAAKVVKNMPDFMKTKYTGKKLKILVYRVPHQGEEQNDHITH